MIRIALIALLCTLFACSEGDDQNSTKPPTTDSQEDTDKGDDTTEIPKAGATIDPNALTMSAVADFGVEPNVESDQSAKLQGALNYLEEQGGGILTIPAGVYHVAEVYMRSNVHIMVSKDATFKPYITDEQRTNVKLSIILFNFTRSAVDTESSYVENCSITCSDKGEQYTVDYSDFNPDSDRSKAYMVRFVRSRMVRDFTIADVKIIDNYTKYCGIIFVGAEVADVADKWELSRPTNGVISNCTIHNASHGYGLTQLHAAKNIQFSNLRAKGGVTLRLEGHAGKNVGVYDIRAKNLYNEEGKAGVMLQPHVVHHGTVTIENVTTVGSAFGVLIRSGFINKASVDDPDVEEGSYASDSTIKGIHCTYGRRGQIEEKDSWIYDPSEYQYIVKARKEGGCVQVEGPSYAAVFDNTDGDYLVKCTDITFEGFANHPESGVLYTVDLLPRTQADTWAIGAKIPAFD